MPRTPAITWAIRRCRAAIATALAALLLVGCGGGIHPGWNPPFALTLQPTAGTASGLRVAWSGGQSSLVVWETEGAGQRSVQALWVPPAEFEVPMTLDTPGPGVPRVPDVAVDAQGRAVVVWLQAVGSTNKVLARRFSPATGWQPAEVLDSTAVANDQPPRVAVHRDGSALVTWLRDAPAYPVVLASTFRPSLGWGPEWRLDTGAGATGAPAVTIDGQGRGMVVWPQQFNLPGPLFTVSGRDVNLTTGAGTTARVAIGGTGASLLQLVTLDDGSVLTACRAVTLVSATFPRVVATSRFDPVAGWSLYEPSAFATEITDVSLAAGSAGAAAVLRGELQDGRQRLTLNRLVGSQVQNATPITVFEQSAPVPPTPPPRLLPQMVLGSGNSAIFVWQLGPQGSAELWASDQAPDALPAAPVRLDQGPSAGVSSAGLALGTRGEAIAAWTQNTANGAQVWVAMRYP